MDTLCGCLAERHWSIAANRKHRPSVGIKDGLRIYDRLRCLRMIYYCHIAYENSILPPPPRAINVVYVTCQDVRVFERCGCVDDVRGTEPSFNVALILN